MDSLSQIVLGAAVGEAYLGSKIGNRALLWGAVAGTIPDLDVVSHLWMSDIDSLAFHRGISHSLFFATIFSALLAWVVYRLYASGHYQSALYRRTSGGIAMALLGIASVSIAVSSILQLGGLAGVAISAVALTLTALLWQRLYRYYMVGRQMDIDISYGQWYIFFFLTIFTHPILDCFTAYGTQLWAPFSDHRVAWNNISVADPAWTLPFGASLVLLSLYERSCTVRRVYLLVGWVWAVAYMGWTGYNKHRVDHVIQQSIEDHGLAASRYMTGPSILNNVLWSATVATTDTIYQGLYSLLDETPRFDLKPIPKNLHLVDDPGNDAVLETLKWFTGGYYTYVLRSDGYVQMNDLRYGSTRADGPPRQDDFVFRFVLDHRADGSYALLSSESGPPKGKEREMMASLLRRVRGI